MNDTLYQNLSLELFRKPIYFRTKHYHYQYPSIAKLFQTNTNSCSETEDEENRTEIVAQPKRIRYLNPYLYYVTDDGYTFPVSANESFAPLHLVNMSNRVSKVTLNKSHEAAYTLCPKFTTSDLVPWEFVVQKYKYGTDREYHDLAIAFENLMKARQKWINQLDTDIQTRTVFSSLKEESLSSTVPQIAEIRRWSEDLRSNFWVLKYIMNKPMQKLLGLHDKNEIFMSLQTGIKSAGFTSRVDSIIALQKYFDNYTKWLTERFKTAQEENPVVKFSRTTIDGTKINVHLTCRMIRYEGNVTNLFSYHFEDELKPEKPIQPSQLLEKSIKRSPEERIALQQTKETALFFAEIFAYTKYIRKDPPQHLVCGIKDLRGADSSIKQEHF